MTALEAPTQLAETTVSPTRLGLRLFTLSFIALFLELMMIRWAPSVVRLVAYYANLMLISSFLGLGVGAMLNRDARRSRLLLTLFPILLVANVLFLLACHSAILPSSSAEARFYSSAPRLFNYVILVGIFAANAVLFVPLGQQIGAVFESLPPLRAYAWDLGGSLTGTLCFGLFSFIHFSPALGMAIVILLMLALMSRTTWMFAVPIFALAIFAVKSANDPAAIWSPYYYITVTESSGQVAGIELPGFAEPPPGLRTMTDPPAFSVCVNHDYYQYHGMLDSRRYTPGSEKADVAAALRVQYGLPYELCAGRNRAAVLGAGGGTDVEMALLSGVKEVDAVEIDPVLVKISGMFNASGVYADPRVHLRVNDARAFLRSTKPGYDLIVFGWLDSQALFSYMSNLRLDGYIYTVESFRSAYRLLNDDGMLSMSFAAGRTWIAPKLVAMMKEATGRMPIVYESEGQIILCTPRRELAAAPPSEHGRFKRIAPTAEAIAAVQPATDDWPFLYLDGKQIPSDYLFVIGVLLVASLAAVVSIRGTAFSVNDAHFLFLGMGFLLLETKSIGDCSLYFGTTWLVTMIVVAGVLIMVLLSNLLAMRLRGTSLWLYAPLIASLLMLYLVPRDAILGLHYGSRLLWSLIAVPLPIFFAGLIFSTTFRVGGSPRLLFGANLVGAMIGGFCEYGGMAIGTSSLMLVVVVAYVASFVCRLRLSSAAT